MAEAHSGKNFGKVIQKTVFRTKEKVLQNLGKADRTTDDDFEKHVAAFNEQQAVLLKLQKEVKHYVACIKEMSLASQNMYRAVKDAYEPEWVGYTELTAAVEQLSNLWDDYNVKVNDDLVGHITSYASRFPEAKAKISKRNRKLTDYDRARHEHEALQTAKKQDEVKQSRALEELNEAKHVYETINSDLHHELPALHLRRVQFTASLVNTLCNVEALFQRESAKVKENAAEATDRLCAETSAAAGGVTEYHPTAGLHAAGEPSASYATQDVEYLNDSVPVSPAVDGTELQQNEHLEADISRTSVNANDESPAASPAVCVDSPQYLERYNGDVVDDAGMTPVMTESHPLSPAEPGHSESDSFTVTERASVDVSPKVEETVELSRDNAVSDEEEREKTEARLSASELLGQDVVPEHRVLFRVQATHKYVGEDLDELTFEPGEIITVVPFDDPEEQDDGWLMGVKESTKEKGVFPENFTRRL